MQLYILGNIMCGVIAILSHDFPVSPSILKKGIHAIYHRGPDSNDYWISNTKKVGLGHVRLSIIDLKMGTQPLKSSNGRIWAVVNGELYGHKEIRKKMQVKGYKFYTNSDSEIIIALYQAYGLKLFTHLRGEFSFILWDEDQQQLIAARDRFGIKPLFYSQVKNNFYFASEIKALIAMGIKPIWNLETVIQLESETKPVIETLFKDVRSITPGHFVIIKHSRFNEYSYWDLRYIKQNSAINYHNELEYIEEFSSIFQESVGLRLRSDVPIGCYLSGGLDSCSILGTMAQIVNKPIEAFTLSFTEDLDYNEVKEAAEMALLVGANHHQIPINFQTIAENFFSAIWHNESSIANTSPVAKFILSQHVQESGYKVVLTGEGADELFAGYAPFHKELTDINVNQKQTNKLNAEQAWKMEKVNSIYTTSSHNLPELSYVKSKLGFLPYYFTSFCSRINYFDTLRSKQLATVAASHIIGKQLIDSLNLNHLKGVCHLNKVLYLWTKTMLPNVLLTALGDRMEMSHSVEARLPFLDHNLAEYAARIPSHMKIKGLNEKYVVRESRKSVLTKTAYRRQKHPFVAPPLIYYNNNPMLNLMREVFNSSLLADLPFYKQTSVINLLDNIEKIPNEHKPGIDMVLTHILSLCVIQNKFHMLL